ncbi:uncharacterized protein LOC142665545 [Rhinoderma darwinii]|uniref:uncharacterized protein LOC142665545 n=1 Tax=Rhinoderma darwinii TaxID=43563 RepID=UPI003F67378B
MASTDLREELSCSICLDLYTDPVTLRCGHNFCRDCIEDVLDTQDGAGVYTCPDCREILVERPALRRNTTLSNIAQHLMSTEPDQEVGSIYCTYCDLPVPAMKSCLQCETSMCDNHLKKHNRSVEHSLVDPPTTRKCPIHKKVLAHYCFEDSIPICIICCQAGEHRGHQLELLDEAVKKKRDVLRNISRNLTLNREELEKRVRGLKEYRKEVAMKTTVLSQKVMALFTDLRRQLDDLENKVLNEMSRLGEKWSISVSDFIQRLEVKMDELYSKMCHVEELRNVTDTARVLREEESKRGDFCGTKDNEKEESKIYSKIVHDAGDLDVGLFSEILHTGLSHILTSANIWFYTLEPSDVVLDLNTAGNNIYISDDFNIVSCSNIIQSRPQTPERFQYNQVLSTRSFSSGRHYWDVETSDFGWWMIGMSYPSIERRGDHSWMGNNDKSWSLCRFWTYSVSHDSEVIPLPHVTSCNKIRIYLDYEAGQLSFYELGDPIRHLHTFTATFIESLYAALWVGWDGSSEEIWLKTLGSRTSISSDPSVVLWPQRLGLALDSGPILGFSHGCEPIELDLIYHLPPTHLHLLPSHFSLQRSEMASGDLRDELSCSICLNIYTDPVTLRCGHNFCLECITDALDTRDEAGVYTCPDCREDLQERPALRKNSNLSNLAERFRQIDCEKANVFCSYCIPVHVPAVICCQHCEALLCGNHLRFHNKSPKHVFSEPPTFMGNRKCSVHKKILKYFCPVDSVCLCVSCKEDCERNGHPVQSLEDAAKSKKETFRNNLEKLSSKRERAEEKIQSLRRHHNKSRAKASGIIERLNTMLINMREQLEVLVNRVLREVTRQEEQVSLSLLDLIKHLEIEKDEMYSKMDHIEQMCNIHDPLTVIQESQRNDFCDMLVEDDEYDQEPYVIGDLDEDLNEQILLVGLSNMMNIAQGVFNVQEPTDLLLDVDTAANNVRLSEDLKTVSWSEESQNRQETPQRFQCYQVLSNESFSSGQHHWEVEISKSGGWVVGICYPSIERKGDPSVIGDNSKSWGLWGFNNKFIMRHDSKHTRLPQNISCHRLRIYLDYEAGQLSFYELSDPVRHLYTFTTTFTEPLHAAFWVYGSKDQDYCRVRIICYKKLKELEKHE